MELSPHASPDVGRLLTLFAGLVAKHGFTAPSTGNARDFICEAGESVLFFAEDPRRVPETWDVAVVLPDIVRVNWPQLRVGLLDPPLARALAREFGVTLWPSLVFLSDGRMLGVIERMRDWDDYARRIAAIRAGVPGAPGLQAGSSNSFKTAGRAS